MDRTGASGRRERNKLEKRKRISAAARALFHAQGFPETTISQISKAAGVAEGTLFLYVARKEDLLILAFVDELDEAVRAAFAALPADASFVERIVAYFSGILAYHEADVPIAKLFLREVGILNDPERDFGFGQIPMMVSLEAIIVEAQERDEIGRDLPVADVARLCFSIYWGALRDWANGLHDATSFRRELVCHFKLMMRGLGAV